MKIKGLIYCRVSSAQQVKNGSGLTSQEKVCRDYATNTLWIEVEKVFHDQGMSWGIFERKAIIELFKYIDGNKESSFTVIFDDLNRLSRDIWVHNLLRSEFRKRWVELQCPNFKFEDTPEGSFKESISVVVSQYEREKNKERVCSRQKARLEQWFWCFPLPIGYKYEKSPQGGKLVVLDLETYRPVRNALNKFASDELRTCADFIHYLNAKGIPVKRDAGDRMLRNLLYAGYLELPKWWIERRKAQHEWLISLNTYERIINKLNRGLNPIESKIEMITNRKDCTDDFPLRGLLFCDKSKHPLTANWATGRNKKYPYYTYGKHTAYYGKSIPRDKVHTKVKSELACIGLKPEYVEAFKEAIKVVKDEMKKDNQWPKKILEQEIKNLDEKINNLIERIWETKSSRIAQSLEEKLLVLEEEKKQKIKKMNGDLNRNGTALNRKAKELKNALQLWKTSSLKNKKSLLKNIFPEWIHIDPEMSNGTARLSLIYQRIKDWKTSKNDMVEVVGIEPTCKLTQHTHLLS